LVKIEFPQIPNEWDYDESVKIGRQIWMRWKDITGEMAEHFYVAREKLRHWGGDRKSKEYQQVIPLVDKTWGDYCQEITGWDKNNARDAFNRMLRSIFGPVIDEHRLDDSMEDLDDRAIIPYDENIYFLSNKFQEKREGDFKLLAEGEIFPTLKRRSWFFHKETGAEFTLREYARVQTFPDTFKFVGTYETIKDQIGNAVAPHMARYVGKKLKGKTLGDLFAGCGGLSYGLVELGKHAIWAVERDAKYARTYKANHPRAMVVTRDIKKLDPGDFKKVDIVVGGPPCPGLSLSGKRLKNDPRNDLYKEFIRFVKMLAPEEFLMENVPQIRGMVPQIIRGFEKAGYNVQTELVKGLEIGMRQRRNRFFFTGKRKKDEDHINE